MTPFNPVPFLRSIEPNYIGDLDEELDETVIAERLQQLADSNDAAWPVALLERERWVAHVLRRLDQGTIEYEDASLGRPVMGLLEEMAEEAADLGGWGAITQEALNGCEAIEPEVRELIAAAIRDAAAAGAQAWARLAQAYTLLSAQEPS